MIYTQSQRQNLADALRAYQPPEGIGAATQGTLKGCPDMGATRAFPDFAQRIAVAQEAAWETHKNLDDLRSRLGILNDFGQSASVPPSDEPMGEVRTIQQQIDRLTDTVRDLRGLAETLNGRL